MTNYQNITYYKIIITVKSHILKDLGFNDYLYKSKYIIFFINIKFYNKLKIITKIH